jgi:hypothetical protein
MASGSVESAALLTPHDLLENVVVKIADEVEVDVNRSAWKIDYSGAIKSALRAEIAGVAVPYVDLKTLIASKETPRPPSPRLRRANGEQDRADIVRLKRLLKEKEGK